MFRRTKIVCTLGPATDDPAVLRALMQNGMNVARFNFSHSNHEDQKKRLEELIRLREELKLPVASLLDTKGPEIRIGYFDTDKITLSAGDSFTLTTRDIVGNRSIVSVSFSDLPKDIETGATILIDDGLIELRVIKIDGTEIVCTVINGGTISARKGINVPGVTLSLPFMSETDWADIKFGVENDFDFIAASFTRRAQDILEIRKALETFNCHNIRIIAKIENLDGVKNIDEIIHVSDGIMVARGDLGVEIPLEEVPILQKQLIKKAYHAGKQVITATQMLNSMMTNPRPTRAESTDVANAIYDGTSAIMLSGETAAGQYPVEALQTMLRIAIRTEQDIDYVSRFRKRTVPDGLTVTNAISHAACTTAHDLEAAAIITVTMSGKTARMISKFRPTCPIICCTTEQKVQRQMNLSWGVSPILVLKKENTDELFEHSVEAAVKEGLLSNGDLVVITTGVPLGISGTTNLLKVHLVGNVLVSGHSATRFSVCGNLCVCQSEEEALKNFTPGDILVIEQTSNNLLDILKHCSGIITEADGLNSHAAIVGMTLEKPVLVGAENATKILKNGTTVTMDSGRSLVYSGITQYTD